jgi:hypothetical protein
MLETSTTLETSTIVDVVDSPASLEDSTGPVLHVSFGNFVTVEILTQNVKL